MKKILAAVLATAALAFAVASRADLPSYGQLGLGTPYFTFNPVTPSDTVSFPSPAKSFFIGTGGNVSLVNISGNTVLFKNLANGQVLPVYATRVNATGTTATDIVSLN